MTQPEMSSAEARRIVRRYVHDLNNIANCLHLEVSAGLEDSPGPSLHGLFQKLEREVTLLDTTIRSLAVRFTEPSCSVVAAFDIFQSWRDKVDRFGEGVALKWEEPSSNPLINVDFNAVVTVLREICLRAARRRHEQPPGAGMFETDDRVVFEIRHPLETEEPGNSPDKSPEMSEWARIVDACGGELQCSCDGTSAPCTTKLLFPKSASPPALLQ